MFFDWREVGVASKPLAYALIATATRAAGICRKTTAGVPNVDI
jgi:hypothetical protein